MEYKNKIQSFTDLEVWKEAHKLVLTIYQLTKDFPKEELFGLVSQMRRAAVSITSNIAEGFSRFSYKEKTQFYSMSHGSLTELQNQILIAKDVGYLGLENFRKLSDQSVIVHKLLNAFIRKTKEFKVLRFVFLVILLHSIFQIPNSPSALAAEVGLGVNKNTFDLEILPGQTHKGELVVFNTSPDVSLPVHVQLNLWDLREDTEDIEFITAEPALNATKWFKLNSSDLIIEPDKSKELGFNITPPDDASPGTYLVMMRFQAVLPEHYFEEEGPRTIPELGVLFFIKIPLLTLEGGKQDYAAEIVSIESSEREGISLIGRARANVFDDAIKILVAKIKNTGIYHFKASGFLEIKNIFGITVYKTELGKRYLLPNRTRSLNIETLPPPPTRAKNQSWFRSTLNSISYILYSNSYLGPYTATLTLSIPNEPPVVSTANFWVIPWKFWLPILAVFFLILYILIKLRHRLADFWRVILKGKPH